MTEPEPIEYDLETAEWCCRSLMQELLQSTPAVNSAIETLDGARHALESGAHGLLRRIASINESNERREAYADLALTMEALLRFGSLLKSDSAPVASARKTLARRLGRPPIADNEAIRAAVLQSMEFHGDFLVGDPVWNAQARLEEVIAKKFGISEIRARALIRAPLEEWRNSKEGS